MAFHATPSPKAMTKEVRLSLSVKLHESVEALAEADKVESAEWIRQALDHVVTARLRATRRSKKDQE